MLAYVHRVCICMLAYVYVHRVCICMLAYVHRVCVCMLAYVHRVCVCPHSLHMYACVCLQIVETPFWQTEVHADIKSRIWRQHHSYREFCVDSRNHCLQAEMLSAHSLINHFQNSRQEVIVTKYILNKRPKIPFKPSNITNLWMHKSLLALLLLYCSYKLSKFKMADKWLPNVVSIITCVLAQRI